MNNAKLIDGLMKEVQRHCYNFAAWAVNHAAEFEDENDFVERFQNEFDDKAEWIAEDFCDVLSIDMDENEGDPDLDSEEEPKPRIIGNINSVSRSVWEQSQEQKQKERERAIKEGRVIKVTVMESEEKPRFYSIPATKIDRGEKPRTLSIPVIRRDGGKQE